MTAREVQARLRALADPDQAAFLGRFFKTGPGEYGYGDIFIGLRVPQVRKIAGEFTRLTLAEARRLLRSKVHEDRLTALVILVGQVAKGDAATRRQIYELYLGHTRYINNWDLVDMSAPQLVGAYLADKSRKPLYTLAKSSLLWDRRISILATLYFIRQNDLTDTLKLAEGLLGDREDLIHKAVGWMLREVGKRDQHALEEFLRQHCKIMPRTMLRYAIERLPPPKRRAYMARS